MNLAPVRAALTVAAIATATVLLGACGSSEDAPAGAKKMAFQLTDAGCVPNNASAPAGPIVFEVENADTSKVTEFEVLEGETILGEKENLSGGFSGTFSLTLDQGKYTLYCPGGEDERGTLTVTGKLKASGGEDRQAEDAVAGYREHLEENTAEPSHRRARKRRPRG